MNLEDHIGDIIRKGRTATGISAQAAAKSAGLSETELETLEETGRINTQANLEMLGQTVGLNATKLAQIAGGWLPKQPDLSIWRELHPIVTTANGMGVNCYLIWDEVSRDAALFDTGWTVDPILKLIEENGLALHHLFLTHLHNDHIAGMEELRHRFPRMHLHSNASSFPPQHRNRPNEYVQLGSLRISHRDTPGHAEEGVTYVIGNWPEDAPFVAIVGDALFAGSIGRGNQSWDLARKKVREQILSLPPDSLLCPGHGPLTTVAEEKEHNPFF